MDIPGMDGWDLLQALWSLLSPLILVAIASVGVAGFVGWIVHRRAPSEMYFRVCMAATGVLVIVWGVGLVTNQLSSGEEMLEIRTTGRTCSGGVMGGPVGICEDMHLCTPVPDSFDTLLTEQPAMPVPGCGAGPDCELQIVWKAAVRLGDDMHEWIVSADQASVDDPDPEAYPQSRIWFTTNGPPTDPAQAAPIGNNDAGSLLYSLRTSVTDSRAHFAHVSGPPDPELCARYLEDPSERTYKFKTR